MFYNMRNMREKERELWAKKSGCATKINCARMISDTQQAQKEVRPMDKGKCLSRISQKCDSEDSTQVERKIALYIREHMEEVLHCTLLELADHIGVSDASVVRFCKSIGYKGFQDFKISAALETVPSPQQYHPALNKADSAESICQKIFALETSALTKTLQYLDIGTLEQIARILGAARRILLCGTGGSQVVARDAQHKLLKVGIHAWAVEDKDIQLMEASLLEREDVLVAFSHSGNNVHTLRAVELAKQNRAVIIALTSSGKTSLAQQADYTLTTVSEPTIFSSESGSTRLAQLAVIDCLVAVIAFQNYDKSLQAMYRTREATSENKS